MSAKIPIIVFVVVFVATTMLTVVLAHVYGEKTGSVQLSGTKALPPFPNVAPLAPVPAEALGPPGSSVCVVLVGDETGKYVPAPLHTLQPCSHQTDCADCTVSTGDAMPVSCQPPGETVREQQDALGNASPAYCLPTPKTCMTVEKGLTSCTHDSQCAVCDDEVGGGEAMQCEIVSDPKKIVLTREDGDEEVVEVPVGQWCLPKTGRCNSENAELRWTTEGWKCTCKFPTIHGGESCDLLTACNNHLTTSWSAGNQQLLVNKPNTEGGLADVWSIESGVNPVLCHVEGEADTSKWDRVCDATTVPNTVCQCDGLMLGSHMGFRNETSDPLTCSPDNCSANALGGRATEPLEIAEWATGIPGNQCVCSGRGARIWDVDTRDPDVVEETDPVLAETLRLQQGHVYTGRCEDTRLATNGAQVVLHATPAHADSVACSNASNQHAEITRLVPGFAVDDTGTANVYVCAADPCTGTYSDPNFRPPETYQSIGHFDASIGSCVCDSAATPTARPVSTTTDNTVNPVGSVCVDACAGMNSDNPEDWPCKQDPFRPCPEKPLCITDAAGKAQCVCRAGCGNTDGFTCAAQFDDKTSCTGYVGVDNICAPDEEGNPSRCLCHRGRFRPDEWPINNAGPCENTDEFYAMCSTTISDNPACHVGGVASFATRCGNQDLQCEGEVGCNQSPLQEGPNFDAIEGHLLHGECYNLPVHASGTYSGASNENSGGAADLAFDNDNYYIYDDRNDRVWIRSGTFVDGVEKLQDIYFVNTLDGMEVELDKAPDGQLGRYNETTTIPGYVSRGQHKVCFYDGLQDKTVHFPLGSSVRFEDDPYSSASA